MSQVQESPFKRHRNEILGYYGAARGATGAGGESEDTFRIYARMTDEERAAFDQWYASIPACRGMSVAFFDWPGFADVRKRLTDEAV